MIRAGCHTEGLPMSNKVGINNARKTVKNRLPYTPPTLQPSKNRKLTFRFMAGISITSCLVQSRSFFIRFTASTYSGGYMKSCYKLLRKTPPPFRSACKHKPCDSSLTASHVTPTLTSHFFFFPPTHSL